MCLDNTRQSLRAICAACAGADREQRSTDSTGTVNKLDREQRTRKGPLAGSSRFDVKRPTKKR